MSDKVAVLHSIQRRLVPWREEVAVCSLLAEWFQTAARGQCTAYLGLAASLEKDRRGEVLCGRWS